LTTSIATEEQTTTTRVFTIWTRTPGKIPHAPSPFPLPNHRAKNKFCNSCKFFRILANAPKIPNNGKLGQLVDEKLNEVNSKNNFDHFVVGHWITMY
jgi:hypothetical protein